MYAIKEQVHSYMVSDSAGTPLYFIVADREQLLHNEKGQEFLVNYLTDAENIFKKEVGTLLNTKRNFTVKDEDRLRLMLNLLIDARKTWEEEEFADKGECC